LILSVHGLLTWSFARPSHRFVGVVVSPIWRIPQPGYLAIVIGSCWRQRCRRVDGGVNGAGQARFRGMPSTVGSACSGMLAAGGRGFHGVAGPVARPPHPRWEHLRGGRQALRSDRGSLRRNATVKFRVFRRERRRRRGSGTTRPLWRGVARSRSCSPHRSRSSRRFRGGWCTRRGGRVGTAACGAYAAA
jgi:hypothetical protein